MILFICFVYEGFKLFLCFGVYHKNIVDESQIAAEFVKISYYLLQFVKIYQIIGIFNI